MAKESKFKKGMEVASKLTDVNNYEIVEVLRNELKVKSLNTGEEFTCKKSLFEVIE